MQVTNNDAKAISFQIFFSRLLKSNCNGKLSNNNRALEASHLQRQLYRIILSENTEDDYAGIKVMVNIAMEI